MLCVCVYLFFLGSILWFFFFIFLFVYVVYCYDIKFNVEAYLCFSGSTLRDQNALYLSRQAETCNAQCGQIWKGPINLKVWLCCIIFHVGCLKCSCDFKTSETIP